METRMELSDGEIEDLVRRAVTITGRGAPQAHDGTRGPIAAAVFIILVTQARDAKLDVDRR